MGTAFLLCGDWHAAEDLTQTTLAKVFAAWHRSRNKDSVHAYPKRTLLNTYSSIAGGSGAATCSAATLAAFRLVVVP